MDKANVRILILALTVVLFIGQAIYDFVKKNRGRAKHHPQQKPRRVERPTAVPARQRPAAQTASYRADKVQEPASQAVASPNYDDRAAADSSMQIDDADFTTLIFQDTGPHELRREIIWSEILKRKF